MKMSDLHIEQMERDESPSTIRIEKNVPYPTNERGNTRVLTLDESNMIQSMEIGDSFMAPEHLVQRPKGLPNVVQLKRAVRDAFKKSGRTCTSRRTQDNQLRVWRIQ